MYKVSIIGCGFVGLTLGVFLAKKGIKVIAVDNDLKKIKRISEGNLTFYEPKLEKNLKKVLKSNFIVSDDINFAINDSDLTFVTVGTPNLSNGKIDRSYIKSAIVQVGKSLAKKKKFHTIVIKSTVVPNTTNKIIKKILEKESKKIVGKQIGLSMNPEFLREGSAVKDTENPHLIVIGANEKKSSEILLKLYKKIYATKIPEIIITSIENAEMIKYANNAFLATKISFINTIANICQKTPNTNVDIIAKAIGKDPRIGSLFLQAGPGYGGSCFPKDVSAIIQFSKESGYEPTLLAATKRVNESQPERVLSLLQQILGKIKNKKISILGLAFKKDTDDIRESVSIKLIRKLLNEKAIIFVHDPMAIDNAKRNLGNKVEFSKNIEGCLENSDCVIIMTDWDNYKNLKVINFKNMRSPNVIDTKRILNLKKDKEKIKLYRIGTS